MEPEELFKSELGLVSSHEGEDSASLPDEDEHFDSDFVGGRAQTCQNQNSDQRNNYASTATVPANLQAKALQGAQLQLNRKVLIRGISEIHLKDGDEQHLPKKFRQITHLHLQSKSLDEMPTFREFRNLTVLYLYNNKINEITGLESLHNLEVLDLHENNIGHISGLKGCVNLQKLYLGHNCIIMIEGLEDLHRLQELHIEYQKLGIAQSLMFDPASTEALSQSLKVLDLSGNGIEYIEDVAELHFLTVLIAKDNLVRELDQVALNLTTLPNITKLDFRGNPFVKAPKYREKMIAYSNQIENLDGKDIPPMTRDSIQRFWRMKAFRLKHAVEQSYKQICSAEGDYNQENQEPEPTDQPHCGSTTSSCGVNETQTGLTHSKAPRRQPRPLGPRYRQMRPKQANAYLAIAAAASKFTSHELPSASGSDSNTISTPRSSSGTYSANLRSRDSRPDSVPSLHSILTRYASGHSQLGARKPEFMLTTPSFLPQRLPGFGFSPYPAQIGNGPMHGAGSRKWMSVLSPIPAGETEEEGDDEGDADASALVLPARPRSPAPNISDAVEITESVSAAGDDAVGDSKELAGPSQSIHGLKPLRAAFVQNVYHLPPWSHLRRFGARQSVVRFIP